MAKKRQADFSKTRLKPGRPLSRRKNVTNTAFKSKKIFVPKKKQISHKALTIKDCLEKVKSSHLSTKQKGLNNLYGVISDQDKSFSSIGEVLECVDHLILETESSIRSAALEVIITILEVTDDLKISTFIPRFINILFCAMTSVNFKIKESSLHLLHFMLKNHSKLICNSPSILINLYEILDVTFPRNCTQTQASKSKGAVSVSPNIYSTDWRIRVLGYINFFLEEMLKNFEENNAEENDEENEMCWNCEYPLHLKIYAGGGLKPFDMVKSFTKSSSFHELYFEDPAVTEDFINKIVKYVTIIYIEEGIAGPSKADDNLLPRATIENLNILFQVLNHVSDWTQLLNYNKVDSAIAKFLLDHICESRRFPFILRPSVFEAKEQYLPCVQLNLAVCYLYSKFLLIADKAKFTDYVFPYINNVFSMSVPIKYDSLPMLMKILKIYFSMFETMPLVSGFINESLFNMSALINMNHDHINRLLVPFFTKLSLKPVYSFLSETEAMKNWFTWLLSKLLGIPEKNEVDKKLLNVIKKIGNCKFTYFLQALAKVTNVAIQGLLKYENADVKDAGIFMIYFMEDINESLLEDISHIILKDASFHHSYAIRLIRLLTSRFKDKPRSTDTDLNTFKKSRLAFIQFLLNIAVDPFDMNSGKWPDYEANEYTKAMIPFKDVTTYNIFPSLRWKEHWKLFEVCCKSLNLLPQKLVNNVAVALFREILDTRNLPVHCVIAILKFHNQYEMKDSYYCYQIHDLFFSSLFTISVLTHMSAEGEWSEWNVVEIMGSMRLNRKSVLQTVEQFIGCDSKMDGLSAFHAVRICKFYVERQLLDRADSGHMLDMLKVIAKKSSDKTLNQQPLFLQLFNYFSYYVREAQIKL